jgi:hypothetical protein
MENATLTLTTHTSITVSKPCDNYHDFQSSLIGSGRYTNVHGCANNTSDWLLTL